MHKMDRGNGEFSTGNFYDTCKWTIIKECLEKIIEQKIKDESK